MLKTFIFLLFCSDFLQSASVDNKKDHIREKRLLSEKEHFDGDHHHDADYDHEAFLGKWYTYDYLLCSYLQQWFFVYLPMYVDTKY